MNPRLRVERSSPQGALVAFEPTTVEVGARAAELAAAYNEPHNSAMLANTVPFAPADVVAHYAAMASWGARQFFLYADGCFLGDADLRHLEEGRAEFAMLIAARDQQGKGLGTLFAVLLHALAFGALGLEQIYVTIVRENVASRRLFAKLGYAIDLSPEARRYADDERDVSMSIARAEFERENATAIAECRISSA